MTRVSAWFQFGVLVCLGVAALTRAAALHRRGVPVLTADRGRTPLQLIGDGLAAACLLIWSWEIIAHAWRVPFHVGPPWMHREVVSHLAAKITGAVLLAAGLGLYGTAVYHLGDSWRMGIDRASAGPLVTTGVYRWTRHPIYLAFDVMVAGTALATGRPVFAALALAIIPLMHAMMLREDHFLADRYGDAFRAYCRATGRYLSWRRPQER